MPSYHFTADAGQPLPGPGPEAIAALLDRLGLPHGGIRILREGGTVTLEGTVSDGEAEERLVLAVGNLQGIERVEDRLTHGRTPGLLDTLGAFARLPAGAAGTAPAGAAVHEARPEAGTRFGPGGSLFHTVQPGETLAAIAARHGQDAAALLAANAPVLTEAAAVQPGMVLRIPQR